MSLSQIPNWNAIEFCVKYLISRGKYINDAKRFNQVCNLKMFVKYCLRDKEFTALPTHKKWFSTSKFSTIKINKNFQQSKNSVCHTKLLRIAQFSL